MKIVFDPVKNEINIRKHGFSLADAEKMDMRKVLEDKRFDYGEVRYRAWGYIEGEACLFAFTITNAEIRAISLRHAHGKEMRKYAKK